MPQKVPLLTHSRLLALVALPAALLLASCASENGADETTPGATSDTEDLESAGSYVHIMDYWKTAADQDRWTSLRQALDGAFDNICGDTFCGGDYSNLHSLGLDCSVSKRTGRVAECVWTFVGSQAAVDAASGKLTVDAPSFQCHVATKSTANALVKGLEADPLHAQVPGAKTSLYDALVPCFAKPIGATPLPAQTKGTFVEALDSFKTGADQNAWISARQQLTDSFDQICGDTFCDGDYGFIQSLAFTCSARSTTNTLGACAWVFGGAYNDVDVNKGGLTVNVKSSRCAVPVKGKATDLAQVLTVAGPLPAIRRPLPGGTATAYDALLGCL
jgi:hypothetical protein